MGDARSKIAIILLLCLILKADAAVMVDSIAGVKTGDWIKLEYSLLNGTYNLEPPEMRIDWIRIEILNVSGSMITVRSTRHLAGGQEQNWTDTSDIAHANSTSGGEVILANSKVGDPIGLGVNITGETTGTYAGAIRTIVYMSYWQHSHGYTWYWDKETGILVEILSMFPHFNSTIKATETNIWTGLWQPIAGRREMLIIVIVVGAAVTALALTFRKRKPREEIPPS